jgi:hypothetical protein
MRNPIGSTCLDCAAVLHIDQLTGELVDGWGEAICQASYRRHVSDRPMVKEDRPAAPSGTGPPAAGHIDSGGAGAYQHRQPDVKGGSGYASAVAARPPAAALDAGHPRRR